MSTAEPIVTLAEQGVARRQSGASTLAARLCAGVLLIATFAGLLAVLLVLRQSRESIAGETEAARAYAKIALDAETSAIGGGAPWAAALGQLRHLCVAFDEPGIRRCENAPIAGVPAWFARAVRPPSHTLRGVLRDGTPVSITVHPRDELREEWEDVRCLLAMIAAAGVATVLLVYATLRTSLAPVDALIEALRRAGRGDYRRRLRLRGPQELRSLASGVNTLTESLAQTAADNRLLLRRCLDVQETERHWIARELHDDVGQYLAALEVDLAVAGREASKVGAPRVAEPLDAARESVRHVFEAVRGMLDRLRPAALEELGLAAALAQLARDWQRRLPDLVLQADIDESVPEPGHEIAMHLYRIAQECLVNVARHAQANQVRIAFRRDGDHLRLAIVDDGRGFDPSLARRGLGLRGMRERAAVMDGRLVVDAARDRGCRIEVTIAVAA